MSSVFERQSRRRKQMKNMKNQKTKSAKENAAKAAESARETAPETAAPAPAPTAPELPPELASMPREERDKLLAALLAQRKADKLAAKKPPKLRMRKLKRCCLWLDETLHEAFKAWAEEKAKDKTIELAGNLLIAEAIGWAIPEGFIFTPKAKTAETEKTAES